MACNTLAILLTVLAMATVTLEPGTQVCCNSKAKIACSVTESTLINWSVQPNITISFLGTNRINSIIFRGGYGASLDDVKRVNGQFFDMISTLSVNATAAVNGTVIECQNGVDSAMTTLTLNSSKYLNYNLLYVCKP